MSRGVAGGRHANTFSKWRELVRGRPVSSRRGCPSPVKAETIPIKKTRSIRGGSNGARCLEDEEFPDINTPE